MRDISHKKTRTCILVERVLVNAGAYALSPLDIMTAIKETGEPTSIPSIYRAIKRMLKMGAIVSVPIPNAPSVYTVKTNPAIATDAALSVERDGALCGFHAHVYAGDKVTLVRRDQLCEASLSRRYHYPHASVDYVHSGINR